MEPGSLQASIFTPAITAQGSEALDSLLPPLPRAGDVLDTNPDNLPGKDALGSFVPTMSVPRAEAGYIW